MSKKKILFAASEVYPFAKTGGLADIAYSLPKALSSEYEVAVILPLYSTIQRDRYKIKPLDKTIILDIGLKKYKVDLFRCNFEGLEYIFVYNEILCDREFFYGTAKAGYADNALRFGIFNYTIISLLIEKKYDVVHLNDWQSALAALLIKEKNIKTRTVFTIHNLAYQGLFDFEVLEELGIDEKYFNLEALEFYKQVNFLKAGIAYSDALTTVSPNYAKEILTQEFGCGLEGFLKQHQHKLSGILNALDATQFSPINDKLIYLPFKNLNEKRVNKKNYLQDFKLKGIIKPLFIFIGRFTWQKGVDLLIEVLPYLCEKDCNVAIIGEGEENYHSRLKEYAQKYPNLHLDFTYNEVLSHRMYAAADFLLMPSFFEPCGLNQMIAMKYGALPIVNSVGGLADSVIDFKQFNPSKKEGNGIVFKDANLKQFKDALQRALMLYSDKKYYNKIIKHNMGCDFSWDQSARSYSELYKEDNHG